MPNDTSSVESGADWHPELVASRRSFLAPLCAMAVAALGLLLLSLMAGTVLAVACQYLAALLGVGVVELVVASAAALITLTLTLCVMVATVLRREDESDDARMAQAIADLVSSQPHVSAPKRRRRRATDGAL